MKGCENNFEIGLQTIGEEMQGPWVNDKFHLGSGSRVKPASFLQGQQRGGCLHSFCFPWSPNEFSSEIGGMYITSYGQYTLPWAGGAAGLFLWNFMGEEGAGAVGSDCSTLCACMLQSEKDAQRVIRRDLAGMWSGRQQRLPLIPSWTCKCFPPLSCLRLKGVCSDNVQRGHSSS